MRMSERRREINRREGKRDEKTRGELGGGLLAGSLCISVGLGRWNLVRCGVFVLALPPPSAGPFTGHRDGGT